MATVTVDEKSRVLSEKLSAGPHGLGDPNDLSLRKVEMEVLIPKIVREKAKAENCYNEVQAFRECCKISPLLLVLKCRNENAIMKDCLVRWYHDDGFKNICKNQYLNERSEYRRTGITKKQKEALKKEATL